MNSVRVDPSEVMIGSRAVVPPDKIGVITQQNMK